MPCTLQTLLVQLVCMALACAANFAEMCPDASSQASVLTAKTQVDEDEVALMQNSMHVLKLQVEHTKRQHAKSDTEGPSQLLAATTNNHSKANTTQGLKLKEALDLYIVTPDENGHLCTACDTPIPSRISAAYKVRHDCGNYSVFEHPEVYDKPLIGFSRHANDKEKETNAFCELNFQKVCADAIENKDFLFQAKSLDVRESEIFYPEYCKLNGFLAPEYRDLQTDFDGMNTMANELCNTKYLKYGWNSTVTFMNLHHTLISASSRGTPTLEQAEFIAASSCAMGSLGCDIAYCSYTYCDKGNGKIGITNKCEGWDPVMGMPPTTKKHLNPSPSIYKSVNPRSNW